MLKAIFLDLDGTLVNGKLRDLKYISPENISACKAAQKQKIYTIINTGRGSRVCRELQKKINFNKYGNYYIAFNGAYIGNLANDKIVYAKFIAKEEANKIIDMAKSFRFSIKFNEPFEFYGTNLLTKIYVKLLGVANVLHKSYHTSRIKNKDYYKILLTGRKKSIVKKLLLILREKCPNLEITTSGNGWVIEITGNNTSKGTAAQVLCKKLGIGITDTAAIGDSMNDASLFNVVGKAVSVKNANKNLKKISTDFTDDHKKHGVARWIEKNI